VGVVVVGAGVVSGGVVSGGVVSGGVVSGGVVSGGVVSGGVVSGGVGSGDTTGVGASVSSGADVLVAAQPVPSIRAATVMVAIRIGNRR
jgi:uncharacterized membrane protein YccC